MPDSSEHLRKAQLSAREFGADVGAEPPARARVVVIGGGIIGASVAVHLAELGWNDVVVVERHSITSGTTWHAAGLVTRTRPAHVLTELASYSRDFYKGLSQRSGIDVGYYESGSLSLAQTTDRMIELNYLQTMARHHGLPAQTLAPDEISKRFPVLDAGGLVGGIFFEGDGTVNPGVAAFATAKAAHDAGVRILEDVEVTGFRTSPSASRLTGVQTDKGTIECQVAVIAGGLWSRDLALLAGANVPVQAVQHVWVQTGPVRGVSRDLPIVRDLDDWFYARHYRGGLVIGAFAPGSVARTTSSIPPDFAFGEFEPDPRHMEGPLAAARRRIPAAREAEIVHFLNGPESFTPDGVFLMGETTEVAGLYVAARLNSQGIIFGPGVGKALAEWISEGAPTVDVSQIDVRRFQPSQNTSAYLLERAPESLARLYAMHWPFLQPKTARGLRRVPLYDRLAAGGAAFGETAGWERANWFSPAGVQTAETDGTGAQAARAPATGATTAGERPLTLPVEHYSFGWQPWFEAASLEHRAAREAAALFDLSSIAKFRVEGATALASVQRIFSSDLDRAIGSVVYTCMLNRRGGIEADLTVTRLGAQSFLVIAPSATQTKVLHWLRRSALEATAVTDFTSALGALAITGPWSARLLSTVTGASLDDVSFPFGTAQEVEIGMVTVLALRMSFAGELGWELYVPVEQIVPLFDTIMTAGRDLGVGTQNPGLTIGAGPGLRLAGYYALDSLRAEKGFLHWGADVGPADTPFEAGIGFTVALDKPVDFMGRKALRVAATRPPSRLLVKIRLDDPEQMLFHGESLVLDDRVVGRVTSGAYGFWLGAAVGLACIEAPPEELEAIVAAQSVEVECAGVTVPATISRQAFYDPDGLRMRGPEAFTAAP